MRSHLPTWLAVACLASQAHSAHAQSTIERWETITTLKGAPQGGGSQTQELCVTAEQVRSGLEQVLINAGARSPQRPEGGPACTLNDLRREGLQVSWNARCEGPRGPMVGQGRGTLSEGQADLLQSFELKTPFGALNLQQSVKARRVGVCQ